MRRSQVFLALIVVLHVGWAARKQAETWLHWPHGDMSKLLSSSFYWVPLVVLLYMWFKADSVERRVHLPMWASFLVPATFPIGIPYYYFRTYPLRPALVHVGLAACFAAICVAALWVGDRLAFNYYAVWTNGG
jgi:hypothetical protein